MKLNVLLEQGIVRIMKTAGGFYLHHSAGRRFLAQILPALQKSGRVRKEQEAQGLHVPLFLIASISSQCNLRCAGCYARAAGGCGSTANQQDLSVDQWRSIFSQAARLGVSFILLAGGEPFLRRDVLALAAEFSRMIFPVFTNGTMLDKAEIEFLDRHRNLIPVLSIEGSKKDTDHRRGEGTDERIRQAMAELKQRHILFGISITVDKNNMDHVMEEAFVQELYGQGCGLTLYVEYVPAEEGTEHLVLDEREIHDLQERCKALKKKFERMIVLSFPGDEQAMGGCLASGRGFFHINPQGNAEPCPFSPYAKQNLCSSSIEEVLKSSYFSDLRELAQKGVHDSGCTLFDQQADVRYLLSR